MQSVKLNGQMRLRIFELLDGLLRNIDVTLQNSATVMFGRRFRFFIIVHTWNEWESYV